MTSFRDWLERWPGDQVLLVTPEEKLTAADLRERSRSLAHHAPALRGKAVALRQASLADTLAALAAFDGVAASLLLLLRGVSEARAGDAGYGYRVIATAALRLADFATVQRIDEVRGVRIGVNRGDVKERCLLRILEALRSLPRAEPKRKDARPQPDLPPCAAR